MKANLIEMEGFLRGKCLPGDMLVNETNAQYLVRKFAEAETKCAALAAENVGLKKQAPTAWYIRMTEEVTTDQAEAEKWRGVPLVRFDFETPATDAFLAEVRASMADEVCLKIRNAITNCYQDEQVGLDAAATLCGEFAAQLRKGASA